VRRKSGTEQGKDSKSKAKEFENKNIRSRKSGAPTSPLTNERIRNHQQQSAQRR
jgi:hypothetical protein